MNRRFSTLIVAGFFAVTGLAAQADAQLFQVDPVHSFTLFEISHLDIGHVWGQGQGPTGAFFLDDDDLGTSSVEVTVKVDSISTGNEQRDKHIKGPDFFDDKQFPTMSFKSTSVKKAGDKSYEVAGNFTLHGVTKPIMVTINKIGEGDRGKQFGYRAGYETTFTIKRSDYNMSAMTNAVGDEVKIIVSLEGKRP